MKGLLYLLLLLLCTQMTQAANYYFSSLSGDDNRTAQQAQNPMSPWQTLDKLNVIDSTLQPGDSVFFKRGEVFYGTINVQSSGVSGNVIYYGAYGTGANPLISEFTELSGWTLYSPGIYYASLDMSNLSMVTINGEAKGMGRYPNTGYLKYEANDQNLSITDNELPALPNWTGAEVVMRKFRFILDRHVVTNHSGTTLYYSTSTTNGNNSAYRPVKGNGYFFQNHLQTLDLFGEWYCDPAAKRLYVFFGANAPANYTVKASTKEYNTKMADVSYVTLENLDFEGGNFTGLNLVNSSNITLLKCNFYNQGGNAIYGIDLNQVALKGGSINTSFSNGINFEYNDNGCTIDGVAIYNTNTIAGMGRSGNGVGIAITVTGDDATITNNKLVGAGYTGIQFSGSNVLVEKNLVDSFCTILDDGGGIYTYTGAINTPYSNRKIKDNIILNGIGAFAGAESNFSEPFGKAAGIFLDENVTGVEVAGNTITACDWGGFVLHNAYGDVFNGNLIYNSRYAVHVAQYTAATRNNTMTNNQYIAKIPAQYALYYRTFVADSPSAMGYFDRNYYARLISDSLTIRVGNLWNGGNGQTAMSLETWKSMYGLDSSSKKSPLVYRTNIDSNVRFEYNATNAVKIVHLPVSYIDVASNQYAGDIGLEPFTGVVLLKTTAKFLLNQVVTFPTIGDKTFGDSPFTLNATSTSGLPVEFHLLSGPATISGNTVTLTGVGTVVVEALQTGNNAYKPAKPVSQRFFVWPPKSQTITFDPIPDKKFGDAPFALKATSTSGLPVSFQVVSGLVSLSDNILTINSPGITTVIIEATQPGDASFKPAPPVRQSFTVAKLNQTISFPQPGSKNYGDPPFALNATASSDLPVSYKVVSGNATLAGNVVIITGGGEVLIQASQGGDETYALASHVSQAFWVWDTVPRTAWHYEWACPASVKSFFSGTNRQDVSYQWQLDKHDGKGYVNLVNNNLYAGVASPTLLLQKVPTSSYGYTYRCKMGDGTVDSYSEEMVLKFYAVWMGSVSTAWEDKGNWSCGAVPDANTDVVVQAGATNSPVVNTNASCRSLKLETDAKLKVNAGVKLTVVGKALN